MSAQPSVSVLAAIDTAIAALTVSQIEQHLSDGTVRSGDAVPLLDRSIGHDLVRIEKTLGASGTLLSASAASIDEALLAMQEARGMITAAVSNVRPAPLFLQVPSTVRAAIDDACSEASVLVPIEPTKLVDQPRPSANPALAQANDDQPNADVPSAKPASSGGRHARIEPILWNHLLSDYLRPEAPSYSACYRRLRSFALEHNLTLPAQETLRRRLLREVDPRTAANARTSTVKRLEGMGDALRTAAQNFGQSLGHALTPVVVNVEPMRRVQPVEKLELPQSAMPAVAAPRANRSATPFRPLPFEQRRARFTAAESYLKQRGLLVTVVDRATQIRTYLITGRKGTWLLDDVVAMAQDMGMPVDG